MHIHLYIYLYTYILRVGWNMCDVDEWEQCREKRRKKEREEDKKYTVYNMITLCFYINHVCV